MVWIWLSLTIVLTVIEISTFQLVSIWLATGALAATIVTAIFPTLAIGWQIAIFLCASAALLIATRPIVKRLLKKTAAQETNLDLVIGKEAVVTEDIDNIRGSGAVKINGLEWSARSENGMAITKDSVVTVISISGNKLIVKY